MPQIQVSVNQNLIEINPAQLVKPAEQILNALGYTDAELSIAIVDDEQMAKLNLEYRGIDSSTDVLSFSMLEGEFGDVCSDLLGDVVISAPTAQLMSFQQNCPLEAILHLLLIHGILHLIGYDHEEGPDEARDMEEKTVELLSELGHSKMSFSWYHQH